MGTLVHLRLDRFISHLPQVLNHRCTIDLIGVFNDNTTFFRLNPNSKHPAQLPQPFMNRVVATASHYILYLYNRFHLLASCQFSRHLFHSVTTLTK